MMGVSVLETALTPPRPPPATIANSAVYVQWQVRMCYFHYQKQKALQGPDGQMGGFTRVLHEGRDDGLSATIPTCVVDRLKEEYGFVVLSRPNALLQMLTKARHGGHTRGTRLGAHTSRLSSHSSPLSRTPARSAPSRRISF